MGGRVPNTGTCGIVPSMSKPLYDLLTQYRETAKTPREKGAYFERLCLAYFSQDDTQKQEYSQAWSYADWARKNGLSQTDTGIDLVVELSDGSGFCAIQCKFVDENLTIQCADLVSFFAASGTSHFNRRVYVDTTRKAHRRSKHRIAALRACHSRK